MITETPAEMVPVTGDTTVEGTHVTVLVGEDVIVKDVELFTTMDDADGFGEVDVDLLHEIASATNAKMAAGQLPQIILTHEKGAPVVGRVTGPVYVATSPHSGVATIFGDMRMSAINFDMYVKSNEWPRRSAEIHVDQRVIYQLALLGRDNPAANVRDVYFDDSSRCVTYTSGDLVTFQSVMPGVASTSPPTGDSPMTPTEMVENLDRDEIETLMDSCKAKLSAMDDDDKSHNAADDDDNSNAQDDEDKSSNKDDDDMSNNNSSEVLLKRLDALDKTVQSLSSKNAELMSHNSALQTRDAWRPKLTALVDEGYSTVDVDVELGRLTKFSSDEQREAHLQYIRDNFRKESSPSQIVGRPLIGTVAPTGGPDSLELNAAQDKQVREYASRNKLTYAESLAKNFPERAKALGFSID